MAAIVPLYFEAARSSVFGLLSLATATASRAPVLICPPWGWDEISSYRARRNWAERLAAAGHPTLRIVFPGTGNSAGGPGDPDRVEAWVETVSRAAANMRESFGPAGVTVIGLGLGGLLAMESVARGAEIEQLVLWGVPASGRAFTREALAFSRMQPWRYGATAAAPGGSEPSPLQPGWLEAGGYLLSAETIEDLKKLGSAPAPNSLRRALLLGRGAGEVDAKTQGLLAEMGAEVTLGSGAGWGQMVSHPERAPLPIAVADAVEAWLAEGEADRSPGAASPGQEALPSWAKGEQRLAVGASEARETPYRVEQDFGRTFGILTEPVPSAPGGLCALFLNAGAVRNIGPNRMWVETARRWAAGGVRSLRLDLEAIGEADGDEHGLDDISSFYAGRYEEELRAVLDDLQERGLGDRFLLVGLCAGAYWAFRVALGDERVEGAVLLNAGALEWRLNLIAEREAHTLSRVGDWRLWRKLLSGKVSAVRVRRFLRSVPRLLSRRRQDAAGFDADLDRLRDTNTHLVLALSGNEPLGREVEAARIAERLERWPNMELVELPGEDHTLRPVWAQLAARELLDNELRRATGAAAEGGRPAAAS